MKKIDISVILMGDIVKSRSHTSSKELSGLFNEAIKGANKKFKEKIKSSLTITLGDEFQGLVTSLKVAFEIATYIRLTLLSKNVSCRFVIGNADITTAINKKVAWNMMGAGLAEAREKLNQKDDLNLYKFSLLNNKKDELLLDGIGLSLTKVEDSWAPAQKRNIAAIILNTDVPKSEVAQMLKISENTLYKSLRTSEFQYYSQQRYTIQEVLNLLDKESK